MNLYKIAVIITFYNRKEKTLACLNSLFDAFETVKDIVSLSVYLTDDGSSDGTSDAICSLFFNYDIHIIQGDGSLFWAGGMRKAWNEAMKSDSYDGYIWLNDDTKVFDNLFDEFIKADKYSKQRYKKGGVYIGATISSNKSQVTYSGYVYTNKFLNSMKKLPPNGRYQECDLGNGNIVYVSRCVTDFLGNLYRGYTHGADFDYTHWAKRKGFPVFIMPDSLGICDNDHGDNAYDYFSSMSMKERVRYLLSPKGFQFRDSLLYQKRFFYYRYPFVCFAAFLKVVMPKLYMKLDIRRKPKKHK